MRESANLSQISQIDPPKDEEYLKMQKLQQTTPYKDLKVKSKFESTKEVVLGYQTLD